DKTVDIIAVSHCHLDHIGGVPYFMKNNKQARVLVSPASQVIIPRILENSVSIMTMQREEKGIKEYPLYSVEDAKALDQHILPMYHAKTRTLQKDGDEIDITFFSAGHVIGASSILLQHKRTSVFFTGDVLFHNQRILKGANWPKKHVDIVITETTRGNTERQKQRDYQSEIDRLINRIDTTISNGGSVLIPAFALGRMQEILKIIHNARLKNKLDKNTPIFCSGLGLGLVDDFDVIAKKLSGVDFRAKILKDLKVKSFRLAKFGKTLQPENPSIFVLSSGMLVENTPAYTTAANLLGDPNNAILFVGYCDPDTPGGQLLASERHTNFFFPALRFSAKIEAYIERFDLSGHADREDLLQAVLELDPRTIVLTHGEPPAREWFMDSIIDNRPKTMVLDPSPGKVYDI
ncbi:MAG: MBL fold metallo-hydrolase, partial [Opitutales bacterium]|nr:MBL fold metallo-hydrolase [Opitutales bacterium]